MKKKSTILPITILLCIVMLTSLTTPAFAQTTNCITTVINSQNVTSPNNITGQQDGAYAVFGAAPNGAQLIGQFATTPLSGSQISICAYTLTNTSAIIDIYMSSSLNGPWIYIGYVIVNSSGLYWWIVGGYILGNCPYIAISTIGGPVYIDTIQIT